ncbi:MAG: hypothetical protein ASARMPREDX12_006678 [Alectoria sarmentosa]|nr:MAG: hypothetical protein ASARMPREDX12_006678 [Alectoria sarmentosa]
MKTQNLIPSLSWAYTAGAIYQLKGGVFGSLTFGGYDRSRLVPNNVTFDLAPDISRDLVVGLQSITSTAANGSAISLLPNSIQTFIDSTFPFIYLPLESCQAFEEAFDLTWNATEEWYFVNDTLHQSLTARNPNITFQIANSQTGGPTVDIVLPYASFDLLASYPTVTDATRYFPLQRATNESQYTLGRTFLQEAYLITNYEFSNFSVSQARFEEGLSENLVALPSADPPSIPNSHSHPSRNSIIGISIGVTAFLTLIIFLVYLAQKRRRYSRKNDMSKSTESPRFSQDLKPANLSALHEIDNNSLYEHRELPDSGKVELLDGNSPSGSGNEISEMPQSPTPAPLYELGTRHTSIATSTGHRQSDRNRYAIFVRTGISLESSDSSGALKESPCVETVISSSPRHKSLNLDRPLPTPPERTLEYLNRALPSIPNSDSTQISSTKTSSSSPISATNGIHTLSSRSSVTTFSDSGTAPPDMSLDMIRKDYDMSWECHRRPEPSLLTLSSREVMIVPEVTGREMREHPSLSSLSTEVEIVVPPRIPKSQILSSPSSRKGEPRPQVLSDKMAIAFNELQESQHEALLQKSIDLARQLSGDFENMSLTELAIEISMISLSLRMAPHIKGFVHVQTNPSYSYSTTKTIENARRIIELFRRVDLNFDISRVCIKIPSTWEGLQACRILQATGVTTLATTLFTLAQAALAAEVGCHYIAPYLNELRVQTEKGYKGGPPLFELCVSAQRYYKQHSFPTQVLPASLTSINEIMLLAGVDHITIAPTLLRELASTEVDPSNTSNLPSLFDEIKTGADQIPPRLSYADDEEAFRMAMTRDANGANEGKLIQAINIFCDVQLKMEAMMRERGAV